MALRAWSLAAPDAVAASGYPAWSNANVMPDFQGGLVVSDYLANGGNSSIMKVTCPPVPSNILAETGACDRTDLDNKRSNRSQPLDRRSSHSHRRRAGARDHQAEPRPPMWGVYSRPDDRSPW
jgi:hypothetical protein